MKILVVTNVCSHYRIPLFEMLVKEHQVKFLFCSKGDEGYRDPSLSIKLGNFDGEYLDGFSLLTGRAGLVFVMIATLTAEAYASR